MPEVVGVRFHGMGKAYDFSLNGLRVREGDAVIVETNKGVQLGFTQDGGKFREEHQIIGNLKPITRVADDEDLANYARNREDEKEAFRICRDKIDEHRLDMNLVDVEYTLDRQKLLFYFTADERVDFRGIVRELAAIFRCRIELRQIGVRDEARMSGGIGICGREFCCSSWLTDFMPVSVKMAKTQDLSMNPAKISGTCGRLMCCLKYEQDQYAETRRIAPRYGSMVMTPRGSASVLHVDHLTEAVTVRLDGGAEDDVYRYQIDELEYDRPSRRRPGVSARPSGSSRTPSEADSSASPGSEDDAAVREHSEGGCQGGCSCPSRQSPSEDTETVIAAGLSWKPETEEADSAASDPAAPFRAADTGSTAGNSRSRRLGKPARPGFIPHPIELNPQGSGESRN